MRVIGAGLLIAIGAIHLDLYLTGYRSIPTIGWLFLFQVVAAFGLGAIILGSRNKLISLLGGGLSIGTLGGYVLSLRINLFGFREVRTTAGIVAGVLEIAAFAALATFVLSPSPNPRDQHVVLAAPYRRLVDRLQGAILTGRWITASISVLAAVLFGLSLAATAPKSTSIGSSRVLLKVTKIHGVSVLTNSHGYTLYWFVPDSALKSTCYGTCAVYWPPVLGVPIASSSLPGKIGTIKRSGSVTQITFDHHPLYSYVGDSAPGVASGNNINLNGGLWHEMTVTG